METNFSGDMAAFFSSVEWDSMAEYEKRRVFNILENHRMMVSFGLAPKKPEFMCLNINKRKQEEDDSCKEIKRYKFVPPFKKKGDGPTVEDNNNNNDNAEIQEESSDKGNRYCRKSKLSEKTMLTTTRRASQRRFSNKSQQKSWMRIPTIEELAQCSEEDFLGFPEEDSVGLIRGLSDLKQAIKNLEKEIETLEESDNEEEVEKEEVETRIPGRRYPKRSVPQKSYAEGEIPDDDDYIYCDDCEHEWEGDCPVHGPLEIVEDVKVPQNPLDLTRASRTVPKQLCIAQSRIPGAGHGVWTRVPLAKGMRFGPYEGALVEPNNTNGYSWQIRRNRRPSHCVDAMHCGLANWMRYVNCARHEEEQNLMAFQYKGQMYYRTVQDLPPHVELLVWYGDDYGRELGIDVDNFHKPQQMESCRGFKCDVCGLKVGSPIYLEQHLKCCRARNHIYRSETVCQGIKGNHKRTHTGEQPYQCDICDYQSTRKYNLINHKRTHTGERPYQCDICDYKTANKSHFIRHKRIHTGERPYQCDICDYKATQKVNLIIHKRTHTGERPYQCDICDYQATIKCNLIIHKRKHSGERPY